MTKHRMFNPTTAWRLPSVLSMTACLLVGCGGGSSGDGAVSGFAVSTVTPDRAMLDALTTFTISGRQLDRVVGVSISACAGLQISNSQPTRLTVTCTPNAAGEQNLQLKDAQGQVLYQGPLFFERQPLVSLITPDRAKLGRLTTFQIQGASLADGISASMSQCSNPQNQSSSGTVLLFSCTPNALGTQTLSIKNASNTVIAQRSITVEPAASISQVTPLQTNVKLDTVFTITGQNFSFPMKIEFPACSSININNQSATQVQFSCAPNQVGTHRLRVLDFSGDVVGQADITINAFLSLPTNVFSTGISTCANMSQNGLLCSASELGELFGLGQDGELQRGRKPAYALFTDDSAPAGTVILDINKCFKDSATGLVWEQKTDDGGLRDQDWTYTWRNTDGASNGGGSSPTKPEAEGSLGTATCSGLANNTCNTADYLTALNKSKYCGYNDWRLPSLIELEHWTDLSAPAGTAAVSSLFRPHTPQVAHWSSSTQASDVQRAWVVDLSSGRLLTLPKTDAHALRAVRR